MGNIKKLSTQQGQGDRIVLIYRESIYNLLPMSAIPDF